MVSFFKYWRAFQCTASGAKVWKKRIHSLNAYGVFKTCQTLRSDGNGWIWAGPLWLHWGATPQREDHWTTAASIATKLREENALTLPKSAIQNAARGTVLKKSTHSEGTSPQTLHWAKKTWRGPFGPWEMTSSTQDLVAASCQCRIGSVQTPGVFMSRFDCLRGFCLVWFGLGCFLLGGSGGFYLWQGAGRVQRCGLAVCPNNSPVQPVLAGRKISLLICMKAGWKYC